MNHEAQGAQSVSEDDRPHELISDDKSVAEAEQSVRRHNSLQAAVQMYPYPSDGTPRERRDSTLKRNKTVEFGPEAIKEAEEVVQEEHGRVRHLYEASDGQVTIEDFVPDEKEEHEQHPRN